MFSVLVCSCEVYELISCPVQSISWDNLRLTELACIAQAGLLSKLRLLVAVGPDVFD